MDRHSATKTGTAQHGQAYTEFINGGRSGKGLNTRARESLTPISKAETFTVPVLYYLKKSDIPEASLARREPAELGKANLLLWQRFKRDREITDRQTTVCFLMFTSLSFSKTGSVDVRDVILTPSFSCSRTEAYLNGRQL